MLIKFLKWRKWVAVPLLVVWLAFTPARGEAAAGAIFGLTAAALGALLVTGAACKYYKPSAGSSYRTNPFGVVTVSLIAGWYSVNQFMQSLWLGKNVAAKFDKTDVENVTAANPGKYPNLEAATKKNQQPKELAVGDKDLQVGLYVNSGQYSGTITVKNGPNVQVASFSNPGVSCSPWSTTGFQCNVRTANATNTAWQYVTWYGCNNVIPPPRQATDNEFASTLAGAAEILAAQDIYSDRYGNEIDDFIKDNPNVIEMVDTANPDETDAPPFVAPAGAGVEPGAGTQTISGLGAEEAARAAEAAEAARGRLDVAKEAAQRAREAADADPTNEELRRLVEIAEAAQLAAEKALEAAEKLALEKAQEAEEKYADVSPDQIKKISFDKWADLMGVMQNTWPFSLLATLAAKYSSFVSGDHNAPVFNIPMPLGHTLTIDMAPFNPIAKMARYALSVCLVIGCTWAIIRFYRGVA